MYTLEEVSVTNLTHTIYLEEIVVAMPTFTEFQHFMSSTYIKLSNIEIMDPLTSVASAKALFQELKSRTTGRCFRKITLPSYLLAFVPSTTNPRQKELTVRCKVSERDDRPCRLW